MKEKVRVVQIGCGKMSKYTMRYVMEKDGEIVAAFDQNEQVIGKDIGEIMELPDYGIKIEDVKNLKEQLERLKPDIAIVTTMSTLNDCAEILRICARCGVNAITTCEEAFYGENSNPTIFKEIDILAKASHCTITGCGYQDVFWGNLITALAGSTHKIVKIKGSSSYNVEDYGIALAKAHGAGLTLEQFDKEVASNDRMSKQEREKKIIEGTFNPSYMWNVAGWLSDYLHLSIEEISQECVPMTSEHDIHSDTLQMDIAAGNATGMSAVVKASTKEGIDFEIECIGKVYAEEDCDKNIWTIMGEPTTTITVERPNTVELTCSDIVNRIPDVINAPNGFIPTSRMPQSRYLSKSLQEYIEK